MKVGEGQDLGQALDALRGWVMREQGRPWSKRRYGYYEPPSALRRKQRKAKSGGTSGESFYVGQGELFARTGPTMAVGK